MYTHINDNLFLTEFDQISILIILSSLFGCKKKFGCKKNFELTKAQELIVGQVSYSHPRVGLGWNFCLRDTHFQTPARFDTVIV